MCHRHNTTCSIFLFGLFLLLNSVNSTAKDCDAIFTYSGSGTTIQFTDLSTVDPGDQIISWKWDFDDGTSSTQQNPTHTFTGGKDKYKVELEITTRDDCDDKENENVEICELQISTNISNDCNGNDQILATITVSDPFDNAKEINIFLDGQLLAGSPFDIDDDAPATVNVNLDGDGLSHTIEAQSVEITDCKATTSFTIPDCGSGCFLSGMSIQAIGGTTHTINIGDNFFAPVNTTIELGDRIIFNWNDGGHSSTSDATTGNDAWNSGVIGAGSTFEVNIQNPGVHRFYCIPHGGPGGVGMSGSIIANCPSASQFTLDITFNTTSTNAQGYNLLVNGVVQPGSPFSYNGTGQQKRSISLPGDGKAYEIQVQDVATPSCVLSRTFNAPNCGAAPSCSLSLSAKETGACDNNDQIGIEISINAINGSTTGYHVFVDNIQISGGPFRYDPSGITTQIINVTGDGNSHTIEIRDAVSASCAASTNITTTNCTIPCSISGLSATTGSSATHRVEVRDFEFFPKDISITAGDIVQWDWTGTVQHTSTSDVTAGADSWDSGLLGQGGTFSTPVLSAGVHRYYCIPHGAPNGVGMAGTISVQPDCTNGMVSVNLNFNATGGSLDGYQVIVDGQSVGTFNYATSVANSAAILVQGDGASHAIRIVDAADTNCSVSTSISTPNCNAPSCALTVTAQEVAACDNLDEVTVALNVSSVGGSDNGFRVLVDNSQIGSYFYEVNGSTNVTIKVNGDAQNHSIQVIDLEDVNCTASTNITTTNCTIPCSISGLSATTDSSATHRVEVRDFEFFPKDITITAGDIVQWDWTGTVQHTSTSDATVGADSWNSGLLGQGGIFTSPVLSAGVHRYYCIPHGAPNGVGMAGTISVQPGCTNGMVSVNLNFNATGGSLDGYQVIVDGQSVGTFSYATSPANSVAVLVQGDGGSHTIRIVDVADANCSTTSSITTPNCNAPSCALTVTAQEIAACDNLDEVTVALNVSSVGGSDNGFRVLVDNSQIGSYFYEVNGSTNVTIKVKGDAQNHSIQVLDLEDVNCTASTNITTTNCTIPCSISGLSATTGSSTTHRVEVRDFEFFPKDITITAGDIVQWDWTGTVQHTSTSDATAGADSWNSGLLGQGGTFTSPVLSAGVHRYYCIPHGAPNGVGMAGTISVQPDCTNGMVSVNLNFNATGGSLDGYQVLVDGRSVGTFNYAAAAANSVAVLVQGDGASHAIRIVDMADANCSTTTSITTPNCNTPLCSLSIIDSETILDCVDNSVTLRIEFSTLNKGSEGFLLYIDGNNPFSDVPFKYDLGDISDFEITLTSPNSEYLLEIVDATDANCRISETFTVPNCDEPCSIEDVQIRVEEEQATIHKVEVRDFEFVPKEINIRAGDIVEFVWTGVIPHTSTSDATTGTDVWNSSLLGEGSSYQVTIQEVGEHPYYCIPHGAPGGVGMAGIIHAKAPCEENNVQVGLTFNAVNAGNNGYHVWIDGQEINGSPYQYAATATQNVSFLMIGDDQEHHLLIQDVDKGDCLAEATFLTPDCNNPCNNFKADFDVTINHQTYEVNFTNTSSSAANSWTWLLDKDGEISMEEHLSYIFADSGIQQVCLIAQAETCTDTICKDLEIGLKSCNAAFDYEIEGLTIQLINQSNFNQGISWKIGENMVVSDEPEVNFTFDSLGIYNVCLSIETDNCSADSCMILDLSNPCLPFQAGFLYDINNTDLSIQLMDNTTGKATNWLWGFGDAETSSENNPVHQYKQPGEYKICLLVQDSELACSKSYCETINIGTTSIIDDKLIQFPITIFPNPSPVLNQNWILEGIQTADYFKTIHLRLFDFSGRMILQTEVEGAPQVNLMSTKTLSEGLYFVEISNQKNNTTYLAKLIVQ